MTPAGTFDYDYDMSGALRGVWNESSGSRKQLETGLGAGTLETYNAAPPSGYSNFTYTGTSLLGSTAFRYNPGSGGIAKNYHFLPYGLEWPGEATDTTTNLKWTGHEQDSESGLYHFLFRNYSPLENRWLSPDPAGWAAADPVNPQSWNRYSYALSTPCTATDPLGLAPPCMFNIELKNQAQVGGNLLSAIQNQASAVFATATGNAVGLNFQFSGSPDFVATLSSSTPAGLWGEAFPGILGLLRFANVYTNNIAAYWHGWPLPTLARADGWTLAHELGHEIAGLGDLKSGAYLMSQNNSHELEYEKFGRSQDLKIGARLSREQIQKLLKDCQKKHKPASGGGGAGEQKLGPEACTTTFEFIWVGDSDTGGWVPIPVSSCDPFSGLGAASQ